jgi:Na+-transporting NADH:ubiquinone oxidoreductase subunit F
MHPSGSGARIVVNDGARKFPAEPGRPLLFSLMANRVLIPSACGGKASCGQCRVRILSGAGGHIKEERALLSGKEMARGVHLACQVRVHGEVRLALPEGYLQARQYTTTVSSIRDLVPGMREVLLEVGSPGPMTFTAGQYIQFLLPGTEDAWEPVSRAYSIASAPSSSNRLTLVFGRVPQGLTTGYVFDRLAVGDEVKVNGPFGEFFLRESENEIILVAGGSGVAPVRGMLLDMAEKRIGRRVTFFFAARTPRDLFYQDDMRRLEEVLPRFRCVPVITNPRPQDDWQGEKGGIASALHRLLPALDHHEAYLCGSPGMIDASIGALRGRGMPGDRIFFDKFS